MRGRIVAALRKDAIRPLSHAATHGVYLAGNRDHEPARLASGR